MTALDPRAVAAARAALELHARVADDDLHLVETAAWLLGVAGEPVPTPRAAREALHARLAAAGGAGDLDGVLALLDTGLGEDDGRLLLLSACELFGLTWPDALVGCVLRHPGRDFRGRMLAGASEPDRLLSLVPADHPGGAGVEIVSELVITGMDRGVPSAGAQARWAEIRAAVPATLTGLRNARLRITARESLDAAVALLDSLAQDGRVDRLEDGAAAVLARLVRADPERAAAMVTDDYDPWERISYLKGLSWWLTLPRAAHPVVAGLLDLADPQVDLAVTGILAGTTELELLDQALTRAGDQDPVQLATALGSRVSRLYAAGAGEGAEQVREHCLAALPPGPVTPDAVPPAVRFEVLAAPAPARVPWGPPPGLP